jgi:DNA polymerase III subunit beta
MQLTVTHKSLISALDLCRRVPDGQSTLPALNSIKLDATGSTLVASATDLYRFAQSTIEATVATPGAICVNAQQLSKIVKGGLSNDEVTLTADDTTLTIKSGRRKFKLSTMFADDFPASPDTSAVKWTAYPAQLFSEFLARVTYAASDDVTRLQLNAVLVKTDGSKQTFVATDGHRISVYAREWETRLPNCLLPLKAVNDLQRIADSADDFEVAFSGADFLVRTESQLFSCKVVAAQFPPYRQVIPEKTTSAVVLPSKELLSAIKAVSLQANARTGGVSLTFSGSDLTVAAQSPENGEASEVLSFDSEQPVKMTIGFNSRLLIDAISQCDDTVKLGLTGELDPMTISSPELDGYLAVVMPMRLG